jgi:uncharacterized membrane protein YcaP (DUF421 family)
MLFDSWAGIGRVAVVGVLAYAALVVMLRVSGNRTLSKMNAFDLIVTVALGSTLATVLLTEEVALAEGVAALALLILLQFLVTSLSVRSGFVSRVVKAEPSLVAHRGRLLPDQLRRARVVEDEVLAAVREQGHPSLDGVAAVVLETDGTFSVIGSAGDGAIPVLANVRGAGEQRGSARGST